MTNTGAMHVDELVTVTNYVCSALSIFGSVFIILCILCFKKVRELYHIRIVLSIVVANLIFTLSGLGSLVPGLLDNNGQNPICKAFGFARQFGSVCSLLLTAVFAVMVLLWTTSGLPNIRKYEKLTIIPVVLFSLALACYLLFTEKLGNSNLICWIRNTGLSKTETFILVFAEFYGILVLVVLTNFYCFIQVIRKKRENISKGQAAQLLLFPGVLVFCFVGAFADRIIITQNNGSPSWLQVWHMAGVQLLGLLNSIIYGYNRSIRLTIKEGLGECCCKCRKRKNPSATSTNLSKALLSDGGFHSRGSSCELSAQEDSKTKISVE